jgi:hypothetical protein
MNLQLYPTTDLLAELIARDAIAIAQTTHRIDGVQFAMRLGESDELRVYALSMCQAMLARFIAGDPGVQHAMQRRFKTSASEEIMLTAMLVRAEHMSALVAGAEDEE